MFRRSRFLPSINSRRSVLSLTERWRELAFTSQLMRAIRQMGPAFLALSCAGVAHAQGTMDFSGAQTLMGTFNMSAPAIQSQVEISYCFEVIAKQPMSALQCQRTDLRNLKQCFEGRVFVGSRQVGQQIPCCSFPSFVRTDLTLVRWFDPTVEVSNMNKGVNDRVARDRVENHLEFSLKSPNTGSTCHG
jgi:hypothetical protein